MELKDFDIKYFTPFRLNDKENQKIRQDYLNLLTLVDKDFIPALSVRNSKTTNDELVGELNKKTVPVEYFNGILGEYNICAYSKNLLVGIVSFISDLRLSDPEALCHFPQVKEGEVARYLTTLAVHPDWRGKNLGNMLYDLFENCFMKEAPAQHFVTRTWGTNDAQLHTLSKRGYKETDIIENHRFDATRKKFIPTVNFHKGKQSNNLLKE